MRASQFLLPTDRDGFGFRRRLQTDDGVVVAAEHLPVDGRRDVAVVVVPGFTLHSRHPRIRRIAEWMRPAAGLVLLDLRGHGGSGGVSTFGWEEVRDVEAAVGWARSLGYGRVATLGFSLGSAVVLRHAALYGGVDAVAAVSGPGEWYYRGTPRMRTLHRLVLPPLGRAAIRLTRRTRLMRGDWAEPYPLDPVAAAAEIDVPLLVVHGERDDLFPAEHGRRVSAAAGAAATLWILPDFGHAEGAVDEPLARRIADWLVTQCHE
ncbi:MAG TPA: alpha/beta fold hydrolase [Jiangellaceae bacterium]|nr:alpha/beta fold hydrolase [Jiangellaceae bacterium]